MPAFSAAGRCTTFAVSKLRPCLIRACIKNLLYQCLPLCHFTNVCIPVGATFGHILSNSSIFLLKREVWNMRVHAVPRRIDSPVLLWVIWFDLICRYCSLVIFAKCCFMSRQQSVQFMLNIGSHHSRQCEEWLMTSTATICASCTFRSTCAN